MRTSAHRAGESQPIPTGDLTTAKKATTSAVWRLHLRYILLAVALNVLVASGLVAFDIYNDLENTRIFLTELAGHAAHAARMLRARSSLTDLETIDGASELTACDMALITPQGLVYHATNPRIGDMVRATGWPGESTPVDETRLLIDSRLDELSGLWWVGRYDDRFRLLIIVPRRPEEEGRVQYMTFAAGITGISMIAMLVILLMASNWMLRKPLVRLIDSLTSALVRDVKRRKKAETGAIQARIEAEHHARFLDNLLNASEEFAIVAAAHDGKVNLLNQVAEQILGVEADEVIGQTTLDELMVSLQSSNEDDPQRDTLQPFLQRSDEEQQIVDTDGKGHVIQLSTSPIRDHDDSPAGRLMIFRDITEQRRVEAELRSKQMQLIQSSRMATLGEMAAGVAHELNQPLNNIGLLSARVTRKLQKVAGSEEGDGPFFLEKLQSIQKQVARAAKIIDHLRVFGRAEPTPLADIDVADVVKGTLTLLGEQLKLHDIELVVDVPDDLPLARGDASRLEQVLINLIVNARFALDEHAEALSSKAEPKRLTIRGRTGRLREKTPSVMLEVEDNGPGMGADVAGRIFEPFYTTKEVGAGTGLGLSISYGIVREFGGSLEVHTRPGQGATFSIILAQATSEGAR